MAIAVNRIKAIMSNPITMDKTTTAVKRVAHDDVCDIVPMTGTCLWKWLSFQS